MKQFELVCKGIVVLGIEMGLVMMEGMFVLFVEE